MVVRVSAGVLVGPLDGQDRALVVIQVSNVVASAVVVLRVKQPAKITPRKLIIISVKSYLPYSFKFLRVKIFMKRPISC